MGDAFFCITLSVLVIRMWWKHHTIQLPQREKKQVNPVTEFDWSKLDKAVSVTVAKKKQKEADNEREKQIADLRKQGFTDELIATIIPTINNGG